MSGKTPFLVNYGGVVSREGNRMAKKEKAERVEREGEGRSREEDLIFSVLGWSHTWRPPIIGL